MVKSLLKQQYFPIMRLKSFIRKTTDLRPNIIDPLSVVFTTLLNQSVNIVTSLINIACDVTMLKATYVIGNRECMPDREDMLEGLH